MTKTPKRLTWRTERRKVSELVPLPNNPRTMTEKQVADLRRSLEKFNLVEIPVIDTDNNIIAGHQRLKIMEMLGRTHDEIEVRVPSRKLTDDEVREYNIRSNRNVGSWDFEMLANSFDQADLLEWGFEPSDLGLGEIRLPNEEPQKEPELEGECLIEIRCSQEDLRSFNDTLEAWGKRDGVTINIS